MSIFSRKKKDVGFTDTQKEELGCLLADILSTHLDPNLLKAQNDTLIEILSTRKRLDNIEDSIDMLDRKLTYIREVIQPIIDGEAVEAKKRIDKVQREFADSQKKLSDKEKDIIFERIFANVYNEAKSAGYHELLDKDDDEIYNGMLKKHNVKPRSEIVGEQIGHEMSKMIMDHIQKETAKDKAEEQAAKGAENKPDEKKDAKKEKSSGKKAKNGSKPRKNRGKQKAG